MLLSHLPLLLLKVAFNVQTTLASATAGDVGLVLASEAAWKGQLHRMGWAAGAGGGGGAEGVWGTGGVKGVRGTGGVEGVRGAEGVRGGGSAAGVEGAGGARGVEGVGDAHVLLSVCQPCWRCVLGVTASLVPSCRQDKNRNDSSEHRTTNPFCPILQAGQKQE